MSLTLVSIRRKVVIGLCATCNIRDIVSEVPLKCGIVAVVTDARVDVGLSVGISVAVSVPSNKVRVVILLTKNILKIISLVL